MLRLSVSLGSGLTVKGGFGTLRLFRTETDATDEEMGGREEEKKRKEKRVH